MATSKPFWQKLSYFKPRRCWKKFRDGKMYYLGAIGVNKSDRAAHDAALVQWREIERVLDAATAKDEVDERRDNAIAEHDTLHISAQLLRGVTPPGVRVVAEDGNPSRERQLLQAAISASGLDDIADFDLGNHPDISVTATIAKFLRDFRTDVGFQEKSLSRHDALRCHLMDFATHIGANTPVANIVAETLTTYRNRQAEQINAQHISHYTGRDRLAAVRQFIRWAWSQEIIDHLPRNIGDRRLGITPPNHKVQHFTIEQIRRMLDEAISRTKLYVSLALNCGMTQKDISDLRRNEVDLKAGTIRRKRSKTHKHKNVPEVTYFLWPSTRDLLKKEMARNGELALLNADGNPLVSETIRDDGKLRRCDTIRSAFGRLIRKVNGDEAKVAAEAGRPAKKIETFFKRLRATSANLLQQHPQHRAVAAYFLAHAPASVKDRHYTSGDDVALAKALRWLGEQVTPTSRRMER